MFLFPQFSRFFFHFVQSRVFFNFCHFFKSSNFQFRPFFSIFQFRSFFSVFQVSISFIFLHFSISFIFSISSNICPFFHFLSNFNFGLIHYFCPFLILSRAVSRNFQSLSICLITVPNVSRNLGNATATLIVRVKKTKKIAKNINVKTGNSIAETVMFNFGFFFSKSFQFFFFFS